jgi:ATP-dependent RNA circularization protein (DNA/RNA ligase family)
MKYPKIETLYNRDEKTHKIIPGELRKNEFAIINSWSVTEKVDGTNIRVMWNFENQTLTFGGRTDNAQLPGNLFAYLSETFKTEMFSEFQSDVILFGEGYGEKIQKVGGLYRKGVSFRLFDVFIGRWWLERDGITEIADKFHINPVPLARTIGSLPVCHSDLMNIIGNWSMVAEEDGGSRDCFPEGIVARSCPLLLDRAGERVMWKLKFKDF